MPLYQNAIGLIRLNLEMIQAGEKPKVVSVGYLTEVQHQAINQIRQAEGKPLLAEPLVIFMGRHLYNSRSADGYTVDDMLAMIESAMSSDALAHATHTLTGILNHNIREDAYGNKITDLAVFELYAKRPKAELYSVIPKGDSGNRPKDRQK